MLRKIYKIKKIPIYFALIGYLIVTTANIFHFHKIDLGTKPELIKSVNEKQNKNNSSDKSDFCPVHLVFNSIHNSIISNLNSNFNLIIYSEKLSIPSDPSKILNQNTFHSFLRAPPNCC